MVALVPLVLATLLVGTASAAHVSCGQTITQSTTLDSDVGPCTGTGIRVGANNITLDLGGRTVFARAPQTGEGAGILVEGRTGVTVRNGRVILFDAGVVIQGGSGNTVTNVVAQDNIGTRATDFGDGIAVFGSSNNVIRRNRAQHNGPFSGISLVGNSDNNLVDNNTVQGNDVESSPTLMDDIGIRVEGPGVNNNVVSNNKVEGNGLDGIQVFFFAANSDNITRRNTLRGNGFHNKAHRAGNGFVSGARLNLVEANLAERNAASGIRINGTNNTIRNNVARNNAVPPLSPGTIAAGGAFDLHDTTFNCDNNVWTNNTGNRNQPCIG
ncbi:MAG TPA: right-handed parallel beta-helix repeat-containing protein [Acidimicrobiales bacterium]|nr:right-handed parallel beta-helix repeat-containing protein [Acidimicrobiales bacterium]